MTVLVAVVFGRDAAATADDSVTIGRRKAMISRAECNRNCNMVQSATTNPFFFACSEFSTEPGKSEKENPDVGGLSHCFAALVLLGV